MLSWGVVDVLLAEKRNDVSWGFLFHALQGNNGFLTGLELKNGFEKVEGLLGLDNGIVRHQDGMDGEASHVLTGKWFRERKTTTKLPLSRQIGIT